MKRLLALVSAFALISGQACADYSYTQGAGTTVKAGTVSSAVLPWFAPVDANGNAATGTLAAGAAPTSGFPALCEYLSGGITLSTGQTAAIQCTASGSLHTTVDNASLAVIGTFWQATQPVSLTSIPPLAAGSNAIGSITNTSFGISGTLPAFAATPTVNLGTLNGAAMAANQPTNAAQGSTTSGQTGRLILGAVTTAAPSYTNAQTSPLSLDTAGNLRVNVMAGGGSGGTSSSFGSAFPSTGTAAGLEYLSSPPTLTTGNMGAFQGDVNGNLKVSVQGCASVVCAPLGQTTMSGSSPVTIASDQSAIPVKTSGDPCFGSAKTNLAISSNATALTQIIAASGSTKIYICSISLVAAGATAFNLNTGTGTNCGTGTAALLGSTTAASGMSLAANGGLTLGNGNGTVAVTAASSELCTLQSNAVIVAGNLTYVQQ